MSSLIERAFIVTAVLYVCVVVWAFMNWRLAAAPLQAQESRPQRFWVGEATKVGRNQNAYLVHDNRTGQCLLVIDMVWNAAAMTSQPWPCQ